MRRTEVKKVVTISDFTRAVAIVAIRLGCIAEAEKVIDAVEQNLVEAIRDGHLAIEVAFGDISIGIVVPG